MKNEIVVSIIVPVYNHEKFIAQCLDSLISQDYKNWEAIIINDGSSDGSLLIIKKYAKLDNRIVVIDQKNLGIYNLHKIYNNALEVAKGEYMAVLEGDDYWPNDKLSRQLKSFTNKNIGLSWGCGIYVDVNGNELLSICDQAKKWGSKIVENSPIGVSTKYLLFASNFFNMPTCSVMYRRQALIEIGGFWQPIGLKWLDRPTWILISLKYGFAYCNFNTAYWRRHDAQITSTNNDIKSSLGYIFDSVKSGSKDQKSILKDQKSIFFKNIIEIKVQLYLTDIYRLSFFKKPLTAGLVIIKLIVITVRYPIRMVKHVKFIGSIRRLNK